MIAMINHMLPGFTPFKPKFNSNDKCTLTIADRYIFLNKKCFNNFKGCPYLEFMFNHKDHLLAIKPVDSNNPYGVHVSVSKSGYNNLSNSSILKEIKVVDVRSKKSEHIQASVVNDYFIIFDLSD